MTLREHTGRTVEFKLVDRNTNIDFAEDWLNAEALQRDTGQQPRLNRSAGYRRGLRGNP